MRIKNMHTIVGIGVNHSGLEFSGDTYVNNDPIWVIWWLGCAPNFVHLPLFLCWLPHQPVMALKGKHMWSPNPFQCQWFAICNWKPKSVTAYSLANLWWQLDVLYNLKSTSTSWSHPTLHILSCAIICVFGLNMSIGYGCDQPHLPHACGSYTQSGFVMHWCPPTPHLASWPQQVGPIFGTKMHVWVALGWVSCPSKECMPIVLNCARAFLKSPWGSFGHAFWFERKRERERERDALVLAWMRDPSHLDHSHELICKLVSSKNLM